MLTDITWQEYLTGIGVLAAIYYAFVVWRYYPQELRKIFNRRKITYDHFDLDAAYEDVVMGKDTVDDRPEQNTNSEIEDIESLVTRIKDFLSSQNAKTAHKDDLMQYTGLMLNEYQSLKNSELRESINELIASECEKNGTALISEGEADLLW